MLLTKNKSWRNGKLLFLSCKEWLQNYFNSSAKKHTQAPAIQTGYSKTSGFSQHKINDQIDLSVRFGNSQCINPHFGHIFNISTKQNQYTDSRHRSFEKESILTDMDKSISGRPFTYQLIQGGLVLQVRGGYKVNGPENSNFNMPFLERAARLSEIKMIELSLLPAKPAGIIKGGISSIFTSSNSRHTHNNCNNLIANSGFINAEGMIHFLDSLRKRSGGKPIGIRIYITDKKDLYDICYAIRKTHFIPDFFVVEEAAGCRDIIYSKNNYHKGLPLYEALLFVSNTLELYGLSGKIKIIAAGKFSAATNILKAIGLGANAVYCKTAESNNHKYNMNRLFLKRRQNPTEIHENITAEILKTMKLLRFRKIEDITISNLLRAEGINQLYDESDSPDKPVMESNFPDINPYRINKTRKEKHLT